MGKVSAKIVGLGWGRKTSKKVEVGVPVVQGFGRRQEGLARGRGEKLGWVGEREKREKIFFLMKEEVGWIFFFFCYNARL